MTTPLRIQAVREYFDEVEVEGDQAPAKTGSSVNFQAAIGPVPAAVAPFRQDDYTVSEREQQQ